MTAEPAPRRRGLWRRYDIWIVLAILLALLVVGYLAPLSLISIHSGQAGVLWRRFSGGTVTDRVFREGFHLVLPWNSMAIYDVRLKQQSRTFDALAADGLRVEVDVAVRYRLVEQNLGLLHQRVGPEFFDVLLAPAVGSRVREAIARVAPEELHSRHRPDIEAAIWRRLSRELDAGDATGLGRGDLVRVEGVFLRSVALPPKVQAAIDSTVAQRQLALEYDYRLLTEDKERRRKEIEADGIRRFQQVAGSSLSDRYLRLRAIEATLELARSGASKVVVIGGDRDGVPLALSPLGDRSDRPPPPGRRPAPPP